MAIERGPDHGTFRWRRSDADADPVVAAFHAVRRMPYASTGRRAPSDLMHEGRGACTAKHLLLAQLLSSLGVTCQVRCVAGHFGRGLPEVSDMPEALRAMIREGGVADIHNIVIADLDGGHTMLDATWHDALIPAGFPVNDDWAGTGQTRLAIEGDLLDHGAQDLLAFKARQLAALPAAEQDRRRRFLEMITQYSATRPN